MINWAAVDRATYRPVISWTMSCPDCGAPCNADVYPLRGGMPECDHRVSFLVDIPVAEVTGTAFDLMGVRS
jgi:hypothetical protein